MSLEDMHIQKPGLGDRVHQESQRDFVALNSIVQVEDDITEHRNSTSLANDLVRQASGTAELYASS